MSGLRVAARLDVKDSWLVKGIQLEGLRKLGRPEDFARRYYEQGADEIIYIDIVASLYNRNNLKDIVRRTTENVFIPITAGGGLRSAEDVREVLASGADKAAINTAALKDPTLITAVAKSFGCQCMVLSIEAKRTPAGDYECYYDNGREHSGRGALEWARKGAALGAGEILLTSVDRDGMRKGMDEELMRAVCSAVDVPVICSGGVGRAEDAVSAASSGASAVAVGSLLHYGGSDVKTIKECLAKNGSEVRLK